MGRACLLQPVIAPSGFPSRIFSEDFPNFVIRIRIPIFVLLRLVRLFVSVGINPQREVQEGTFQSTVCNIASAQFIDVHILSP